MSAEVKRMKEEGRKRSTLSGEAVASARHSRESANPVSLSCSSFRTPRSGDPESSSLPLIVEQRGDSVRAQAAMPWPIVRLGDVAKTSSGGTPKRSVSSYYNGDIPWVKSGELGDRIVYETGEKISRAALEQSSAKLFPKGTLCVALYGATVGKLGILGIEAATNQAVCGIFLPESIDTRFAYRFLESKRRELIEKGKGGAQPNISQEIIRDLEFPLPPIDVQRQTVAEIEKQFTRLDAGVAALRRVQANLKRYRTAVLKAACEGRLVPTEAELAKAEGRTCETGEQLLARILADRRKHWHGRGKYKEPAAPDITDLPPLPDGWAWATVEQLNLADRPCAYGVLQPGDDIEGGVSFVRVGDISDGKIDQSNLKRITPSIAAKYPRTKLQGGELVITLVGAIGRTAIVPASLKGGNVARAVGVVPLGPELDQHWAEIWFRNPQKVTEMTAKSHEVARKTLNLEDVRAASVALPPIAEQARIVAEVERRLSVIDELESAVAANLQRATRLRQAILRRAFATGVA